MPPSAAPSASVDPSMRSVAWCSAGAGDMLIHWQRNGAAEPGGRKIHFDRPAKIGGEHALDEKPAETAALRRAHDGTATLEPADGERRSRRFAHHRPGDAYPALGRRQCSVLGRIGGEFVDGEAESQRTTRIEYDGRAGQADIFAIVATVWS